MAHLVFVHGVATRGGDEYVSAVENRDALIKRVLFADPSMKIVSPMWGDLVPKINDKVYRTNDGKVGIFRIGGADFESTPRGLGTDEKGASRNVSVASVGKQAPVAALDAIFTELVERASRDGRSLKSEEIEAFASAVDQIASSAVAATFSGEIDDDALASKLSSKGAAFGLVNSIRDAVRAVTDRIKNAASTIGFDAVRGTLTPQVGIFFGDVFAYLKAGDTREKIRAKVREDLLKSHFAAKQDGKPIVLMGHSLGGVILVDMLLDLKASGLPEDFQVGSLITIGSQPGFFGTLNLLAQTTQSDAKISKPACVKDWMNVFDPIDPFAFRADMIFDGAKDFRFDTVAGLIETHSAYFSRPQFYERARKRLKDVGII